MKLLVFAHTPPPHHGQSYMVQYMLNGFGGDQRKKRNRLQESPPFGVECYHVNARISKTLEDIGEIQSVKLLRLFLFCLQAIWCRFRYGVDNFYYDPAPGKTCRPLPRLACFPTRYSAENQPVTLIEAMAFGLPIVTTRWRSIPEMFPPGYPGLVADQSTRPIADALLALMTAETGEGLRDIFLRNFTL